MSYSDVGVHCTILSRKQIYNQPTKASVAVILSLKTIPCHQNTFTIQDCQFCCHQPPKDSYFHNPCLNNENLESMAFRSETISSTSLLRGRQQKSRNHAKLDCIVCSKNRRGHALNLTTVYRWISELIGSETIAFWGNF